MGGRGFETQRLDHLGIVAGVCEELGFIAALAGHIGVTQRKVSVGQAVPHCIGICGSCVVFDAGVFFKQAGRGLDWSRSGMLRLERRQFGSCPRLCLRSGGDGDVCLCFPACFVGFWDCASVRSFGQ